MGETEKATDYADLHCRKSARGLPKAIKYGGKADAAKLDDRERSTGTQTQRVPPPIAPVKEKHEIRTKV